MELKECLPGVDNTQADKSDPARQFKLKGPMLEPKSQPTYFDDLVREIEEAPKRSWFERLGKRLSGMIRLQ